MSRRVLIFAEAISLSHMARPLLLEKDLAAAGYETFFACDPRHKSLLKDLKGKYVPISSIEGKKVFARIRAGKTLFPYRLLKQYVEADRALLSKLKPDLIIGDMRWSLGVSAKLEKVPYAAITNSYWSPYTNLDVVELPYHRLIRILGRKISNRIFHAAFPRVERTFCAPMNRLLAHYGLSDRISSLRDLNSFADYLLFSDLPSVHSVSKLLSNHFYLGPCLWNYPCDLPSWWGRLDPQKRTVYVNLGTSGATKLLSKILRVLEKLPVQTIVGGLPENSSPKYFSANWLPSRECCERASLCINNGGSTSAYLAVAAGCPVLGIVSYYEQALSMQGFQKAGAGLLLNESDATSRRIESFVRELLFQESYAQRARTIASEISKANGCWNSRDAIQAILNDCEVRKAS